MERMVEPIKVWCKMECLGKVQSTLRMWMFAIRDGPVTMRPDMRLRMRVGETMFKHDDTAAVAMDVADGGGDVGGR
jgi:hypothetical protein